MNLNPFKRSKKKIQAMAVEGAENPVDLESFLTGLPVSNSGDEKIYRSYPAQTSAIYRKYNGKDEVGNAQLRTVVDLRRATISGEGPSLQVPNPNTAKWIDNWLDKNRLKGSKFFNWVLGGEMAGKSLINIIPDNTTSFVRAYHFPFNNGANGVDYDIKLGNNYDFDTVKEVYKKVSNGTKAPMNLKNFQYVKLGGDDTDVNQTTTKVGLCLHEMESYDRALNGIRKNNHLFSRITPTFQTASLTETNNLAAWIKAVKWKIGMIFAGTAKLLYIGPPTTAHDNYKTEMASTIKVISSTTGMPVHWLGHVDMMSNRATASELYDLINNATVIERTVWAEALKEIIIKAMRLSIDSGFENKKTKQGEAILTTIDRDFSVTIPVMSWTKMESYIKSLSIAFKDGVLSDLNYMGKLPDVDPYTNKKRLDEMKAEEAAITAQAINDNINDDIDDNEGEEEAPEKDEKKEK